MRKKIIFIFIFAFCIFNFLKEKEDKKIISDKRMERQSSKYLSGDITQKSIHLSEEKVASCLQEEDNCLALEKYKKQIGKDKFFDPSLTPFHHQLISKMEKGISSWDREELIKALDINNLDIYMMALEELYKRNLNKNEKRYLLRQIQKKRSDALALALTSGLKLGEHSKETAFREMLKAYKKDFSTALSLSQKLFTFRFNEDQFKSFLKLSCTYKAKTDKELFSFLINNLKKQAFHLGLDNKKLSFCSV